MKNEEHKIITFTRIANLVMTRTYNVLVYNTFSIIIIVNNTIHRFFLNSFRPQPSTLQPSRAHTFRRI